MFHVLLALPVLAVFGAAAGAALAVMLGLLALAFFAELVLGLFFRTLRWLVWLPVSLGVGGLALCFLAALPAAPVLVFWLLYGLMLLFGWVISLLLWGIFHWLRG